ncbi:MAG TPA: DUF3147 family protein [Kineosporiaceae bacterium]|nr:DUF3147 family protein [Kineosporiaceae bacterium]
MAAQGVQLLAKALFGGVLVVAFAALAETLSPKRFAGVFAAAPSVALAGLSVTVLAKGPVQARLHCTGMVAGAVAFLAYALLSPAVMRRFGARRGAAAGLAAWLVVSAVVLPVSAAATAAPLAAGAGARTPDSGRDRRCPRLRCEPGKLRQARPREWGIRFGFGAGTSLLAALVGLAFGPVIGGTLLAFPAILLASLTLVAEKEGGARSRDDARGAAAGGLGLVAFAAVGATWFHRGTITAAFALATASWLVVALAAYGLAWLTGFGADEPVAGDGSGGEARTEGGRLST